MQKLYFSNKGFFDVRAMLTFGVSVKKEGAIGYFGTGFKYAVAMILRLGGKIKVATTTDDGIVHLVEFYAIKEVIGGQEFDVVKYRYLAGDKLTREPVDAGFTTRLGIAWEPWMALRELYCNMRDEGGSVSSHRPQPGLVDTQTIITVECAQLSAEFNQRDRYFCFEEQNRQPLYKDETIEIYHGRDAHYFYYRGVAVRGAPKHSLFTYNILSHVRLTEDRMCAYSWEIEDPIIKGVQAMTDKRVIEMLLEGKGDQFERGLGYSQHNTTSPEFIDVAEMMLKTGRLENNSARYILNEIKERRADYELRELTAVDKQALDKAIRFLAALDVNVGEFPMIFCVGMGPNVMGKAHEGKIYLSELPFLMGTKQLASTLLEEWVHLKHGCDDFDRTMQSWLFDKILSLGENINGAPL